MAKVAFLVGDMFEDSEFRVPYDRIKDAGYEAVVVGVERGASIKGKKGKETITSERAAEDVEASEFDAVVIPGGYSPDHIRTSGPMVRIVRDAFNQGKIVAAVCHGPSLLIDAGILDGRTITSWPSIKADLINARAQWVDREVVEDGKLITSRNPGDLGAFSDAILRQLETGVSERRVA